VFPFFHPLLPSDQMKGASGSGIVTLIFGNTPDESRRQLRSFGKMAPKHWDFVAIPVGTLGKVTFFHLMYWLM
jgi:hypothetical protein